MRPQVYAIDGVIPVVDPSAFVHPTAVLIGDVVIGPGCYIGPLASLRGDFGALRVGAGANVQDCCVLHAFPGQDVVIEEDGHVGHAAILHGCVVGRNALVGMNAVMMDGSALGDSSILAAQSFVKAGMIIPPRSLAAGAPAKLVRPLTDAEIAWKAEGTREYQRLAVRSAATMVACEPLAAVPADRPRLDVTALAPLHKTQR